MADKAPYNAMVERYERLKKQYFGAGLGKQYDDEGEELPQALSRAQLIQQFENMGVEIPLTPDQPMKMANRRSE
jgi:hypothetical protein